MTHVGPAPATAATAATAVRPSYLEWAPVIAGALLAAALSFVLASFGAAIGLSATSPWPNSGLSAGLIASLAAFWTLVQQIGAVMAGGYIAGRMRTRWQDAPRHEVEFRDGLHGALVWAVGIIIGAGLLMAVAGSVARTGAEVAGKAVTVAGSNANPMDAVLDTMLRPAAPAAPEQGQAGRAAQPENPRVVIARVLAGSVAQGNLSNENKTYLAQLVSQQTGLPLQAAETRVNNAVTAAREAADNARRAAVLTGLVVAVSLVISLGAAWWAALKGGQHRDSSVPARFEFARRRSVSTPRAS